MNLESVLKMRELELQSDCTKNSTYIDNNTNEVNGLFAICEKVIAKDKYILHTDATCENEPNIALGLSDSSCEIYSLSLNQLAKLTTLTELDDRIIDCKFSPTDSHLLYTGSSNGNIKMWDLRIPEKPALIFQDPAFENNTQARTFSCFDIACNERVITVGTDLFEGDAFLLFYDVRNSKFLGGYWESHTDDITQVKFHPYDRDKLISGSTDGLINIYDLSQSSEDDALIDTLNTQSSIEQLLWFGGRDKSSISCITHTSDLQLWHAEGAEPYKHFTRGDIAREIKVASEDYVYISKCHTADESLLVLAGSNDTEDCACSLYIRNGNLQPAVTLKENKQIVRSSWYNENTNILLTGGEKGILNVWKLDCRRDFNVKTKKSR